MVVIKIEISQENDGTTTGVYYGTLTINGKSAGACASRIPSNVVDALAKIANVHPDS